ncbi:YceI family protein [Aquimarina sp. W85]|uniref:YceI family protein n=1 Tax=Aquimarina rhodophyticola TaxID=3342246 RepID=UPI00366FAD6F
MKTIVTSAILVAVTLFTSTVNAQRKDIKASESTIEWTGKKITGSHTGTLNFSDGYLEFKDDAIVGGAFTVDMTSLNVTDLEAGKGKEKLEGHLTSDDFFGTKNNPKAMLKVTSATKSDKTYTVVGDLTIKGKTAPITFDLLVNDTVATTTLDVNRTVYDIKYGSGSFFDNLGDKAISDDFTLDVTLKM